MTNHTYGLSAKEVEQQIKKGLVNTNANPPTKTVAQIFRTNMVTFFNFLNIGLAIAVILVGSYQNAMFMGVILINTAVGIFQELRAKRTIDKLSLISAPKARVVRDGQQREIGIEEMVLGDLTVLSAGMQVCSDSVVLFGECEVNESLITGESDPILKKAGDELLSGSFIICGEVKAEVCRVGEANFAAKITTGAKYLKKTKSHMLSSMNKLIKILAVCIIPIGALMFYKSIFVTGEDMVGAVVSSVASIIGMIPEGLVLLISVVFAVSAIRLARHNTLVQDMYCVETLARVDTLCLDKTGTITTGKMSVREMFVLSNKTDRAAINQAMINVMAALPDDNPTAAATREYFSHEGKVDERWVVDKTMPFSSAKKWSGVTFGKQGTFVMGAAEFVIPNLPSDLRHEISRFAKSENRVVLIAHSTEDFSDRNLPQNLVPIALLTISDTIRPEAADSLRFFREQDVDIKIISGDAPTTVAAIAAKVGLTNGSKYIDMSTVSEEDIAEVAELYTVFGRVLPEQKLALVKALRSSGHTVGMTGDGVNDVLALKEADCSIAMQSGSDAARNVSSLVLLDSNFASLPKVVAEGRRSINNVERSAMLFLSKTVYAAILAVLFILVQEPFPFVPIQQTVVNAFFIGLPSFVLALEPNSRLIKGRFLENVLKRSIPYGLSCAIAVMAVTVCGHIFDLQIDEVRSVSTYVLGAMSLFVLYRIASPILLHRGVLIGFCTLMFVLANCALSEVITHVPFTLTMIVIAVAVAAGGAMLVIFLPNTAEKLIKAYKKRKAERKS